MELTIAEFNGEVQQKILDSLNKEYLSTGRFIKDQMSVSPKVLSSLMLSGGAAGTAVSTAMSSSLFIATANPTTLMQIGGGVGSAVMGASGIVGQAPFVAAAGAIVPVVAPLTAVQALSSVVMLQQFSMLDKKLDSIKVSIDKMLARQEITKIAELFTAVHIVDEIYLQYKETGFFSTDMLIRLSLAERDTMILSRRYVMLESSNSDVTDTYCDTYCAMLASFLNLRVKYLRTCVDVQENAQFVWRSSENFNDLLKESVVLWDELSNKSKKVKENVDVLNEKAKNANLIQKLTGDTSKKLAQENKKYTDTLEKERVILEDFLALIDIAKQFSQDSKSQMPPTLLYWCDNEGEHCIATNEQILEAVA